MPEDVEPKEPDYLGDPHDGRFIIPEGIRPVLKEFRIEVRCLPVGWNPAWSSDVPVRPEQMRNGGV